MQLLPVTLQPVMLALRSLSMTVKNTGGVLAAHHGTVRPLTWQRQEPSQTFYVNMRRDPSSNKLYEVRHGIHPGNKRRDLS